MLPTMYRYRRALRLIRLRREGHSPAQAWRIVNPNFKGKDSSAAEMTRHEIRWVRKKLKRAAAARKARKAALRKKRALRKKGIIQGPPEKPAPIQPPEPKPPPKMKGCAGVADRPCATEIPVRGNWKRCATCSKENKRLQKVDQNATYYRANNERLCKRAFDRRQEERARERELEQALERAREEQAREEERAREAARSRAVGEELVKKLKSDPEYLRQFREALFAGTK